MNPSGVAAVQSKPAAATMRHPSKLSRADDQRRDQRRRQQDYAKRDATMKICPDDEHGRERPEMAPADDDPESDRDQREAEYLRPERPGRTRHDNSGAEQHESNASGCRRQAGDHGPAACDDRGAQCRQQRQTPCLVRGIEQDLRQPLMVRPVTAADRVGELVAQHDVMRVPHHLARTQLPPCVGLGRHQAGGQRQDKKQERGRKPLERQRIRAAGQERGHRCRGRCKTRTAWNDSSSGCCLRFRSTGPKGLTRS